MTGYCIACNENTKTRFPSRTQFFNKLDAPSAYTGLPVVRVTQKPKGLSWGAGVAQW